MGIFNKLFGGADKGADSKIRAQFKDAKYFRSEIERCNKWIHTFKEDNDAYLKAHGQLLSKHYKSVLGTLNTRIEDLYSSGEEVPQILPYVTEAIDYFYRSWSETYKGNALILQMVSFAILFNASVEDFKKIIEFVEQTDQNPVPDTLKPDSLIFYLIGQSDKKREGYKPYSLLYRITQLPPAEIPDALLDYLNHWYDLHQAQAWYNTHVRDWGYSGYWAWEVAAVVKVMGIDDSSFKENPYYPYDLVHWQCVTGYH